MANPISPLKRIAKHPLTQALLGDVAVMVGIDTVKSLVKKPDGTYEKTTELPHLPEAFMEIEDITQKEEVAEWLKTLSNTQKRKLRLLSKENLVTFLAMTRNQRTNALDAVFEKTTLEVARDAIKKIEARSVSLPKTTARLERLGERARRPDPPDPAWMISLRTWIEGKWEKITTRKH